MDKHILLKSQKNEIFELILSREFDPINFQWCEVQSERHRDLPTVPELRFVDSGFFFVFDTERDRHVARYSPGSERLVVEGAPATWMAQKNHFRTWLSFLKREIEQPDLWYEISKYQLPSDSDSTPADFNEPFTVNEFEQIERGLDQIKSHLLENFAESEEHVQFVEERLQYLTESAKRQGRKDWLHTCIGVIFTMATSLTLAPEEAQNIWLMIKSFVSGIVQFLPK